MRRAAIGRLDHSAITDFWPDTAYLPINWQAVGLDPDDPRVRQILSQCAVAASDSGHSVNPPPAQTSSAAPRIRGYVVNGLALGAPFDPQSDSAAGYTCHASDDYTGFAWCQSHHAKSRKFGPETIWMSVFGSGTNGRGRDRSSCRPGVLPARRRRARNSTSVARFRPAGARHLPPISPREATCRCIAVWGAVNLTTLEFANAGCAAARRTYSPAACS